MTFDYYQYTNFRRLQLSEIIYVEFTGGFNMNTGEALEPLPNINRITRLPNNYRSLSTTIVH